MKKKLLIFMLMFVVSVSVLLPTTKTYAAETIYVNETPFQIKQGYSYFYGYSTLVNRHYIYEMPSHENGIYVKERYFLKGDTEVSSYNWINANSYYLVGSAFQRDSTVNSYMSGISFTGRYPAFESNITVTPEAFLNKVNVQIAKPTPTPMPADSLWYTISQTDIKSGLLVEIKILFKTILIVVLLIIGFRKAWQFLKANISGA